MWFSITKDHLSVPFTATHAPPQAPCPLHALLTVPPAPCICHPAVALTCCMRHLTVLLSLYILCHHAPCRRTCHRTCHIAVHSAVACATSPSLSQPPMPPTSPQP